MRLTPAQRDLLLAMQRGASVKRYGRFAGRPACFVRDPAFDATKCTATITAIISKGLAECGPKNPWGDCLVMLTAAGLEWSDKT